MHTFLAPLSLFIWVNIISKGRRLPGAQCLCMGCPLMHGVPPYAWGAPLCMGCPLAAMPPCASPCALLVFENPCVHTPKRIVQVMGQAARKPLLCIFLKKDCVCPTTCRQGPGRGSRGGPTLGGAARPGGRQASGRVLGGHAAATQRGHGLHGPAACGVPGRAIHVSVCVSAPGCSDHWNTH